MVEMRDAVNPSENVEAYGHDPETGELHIRYSGYYRKRDQTTVPAATYVYEGAAHHHDGIKAADEDPAVSLGQHIRHHIVKGGYKFRKM